MKMKELFHGLFKKALLTTEIIKNVKIING